MSLMPAASPEGRNDDLIARIRRVHSTRVLDAIETILDREAQDPALCRLDDAGMAAILEELLGDS